MRLLEKDIEKTCTEWLALDGWRSFKMEQNFSERKQKSVGEAGMPDRLYVRYLKGDRIEHVMPSQFMKIIFAAVLKEPAAEVLWIEFKQVRGIIKRNQFDWADRERARGALVLIARIDFEPTIEGFQEWYRASGLMRRNLR